jgi:hypothetical protein
MAFYVDKPPVAVYHCLLFKTMRSSPRNKEIVQILFLACGLIFVPLTAPGGIPSLPVLHLVNESGQNIENTLSSSVPFVTDFKGTNDVTVTELAGSLDSDYIDTFGGADSFDNPSYITNFVGAAANGTGDGTAGDIEDIQTSGGLSLQFDFALRLTPDDRFFLIDCDNTEQYEVQAFIKSGSNYIAESLVNWVVQNYAGSTEELPNSSFPVWTATNGFLTAQGAGLDEPLTVFTPDQTVDRVIVTQDVSGGGTATLQFINPVATWEFWGSASTERMSWFRCQATASFHRYRRPSIWRRGFGRLFPAMPPRGFLRFPSAPIGNNFSA